MQAAYDLVLTLHSVDTAQAVKEWRVPLGGDGPKTFWKANEIVQTAYELDAGAINQGRYHLDIALERRTAEPQDTAQAEQPGPVARIENIQDKVVVRLVKQ